MKQLAGGIAFWLCLPLATLQGLRLKRTAIRLPEARGKRTGKCGTGEAFRLLALGDSIMAGTGTSVIEQSFPVQFSNALADRFQYSVHWQIEGKNGLDISQLRQRLTTMQPDEEVDMVVISIGVNDVTGLRRKKSWRVQLHALVVELRLMWPAAKIVFLGLPPMGSFPLPPQPLRFALGKRAAALDGITADVISLHDNMLHIPSFADPDQLEFCEDGFHPSANGCHNWARTLAQSI